MGVYIAGIDKKECAECLFRGYNHCIITDDYIGVDAEYPSDKCPIVEIKSPHGRLIDADRLEVEMYHEAFETDSELQKWDSGCWIRYKMFENHMAKAPTVLKGD